MVAIYRNTDLYTEQKYYDWGYEIQQRSKLQGEKGLDNQRQIQNNGWHVNTNKVNTNEWHKLERKNLT